MRYKIRGSIVNISSVAARDGVIGQSVYGATKAAIESMSKSIAKELGKNDIRINCIAPGVTETPFIKSMSKNVLDDYRDNTYLRRLGNPADIADVAVFLASDQSKHITGQVIRVDGGQN